MASFIGNQDSFKTRSNKRAFINRQTVVCPIDKFEHFSNKDCPVCDAKKSGMNYCAKHFTAFRKEFNQCFKCYREGVKKNG